VKEHHHKTSRKKKEKKKTENKNFAVTPNYPVSQAKPNQAKPISRRSSLNCRIRLVGQSSKTFRVMKLSLIGLLLLMVPQLRVESLVHDHHKFRSEYPKQRQQTTDLWGHGRSNTDHDSDSTTASTFHRSQRRTMLKQILLLPQPLLLLLLSSTSSVRALSPQDAATAYDSYASTYDDLDGGSVAALFGIDQARTELLSQARGHVLELAVGTGLNLNSYNPQQLTSLTLVDISEGMLQEAKTRVKSIPQLQSIPITFVKADATSQLTELFGTNTFDTVVDTFSLCVFGNQGAQNALNEIRHVTKSHSGRVLLLENTRSSNPLLGLYQDVTADAAASMGGKGCVYNQDVTRLLQGSGMDILQQQDYASGLFRAFVCAVPSLSR